MKNPPTAAAYLYRLAKQQWKLGLSAFLLLGLWNLMSLMHPVLVQWVVDGMTVAADLDSKLAVLEDGIWLLAGLLVVMYVAGRIGVIIAMRFTARIIVDAAEDQLSYVSRHSYGYFLNRFAGSINGKISSASDGLQTFLQQIFFEALRRSFAAVGAIVIMATVTPWLGLLFVALAGLLIVVDVKMIKNRRPINKAYSEANTTYRGQSVDVLTNMTAVRQYAQQSTEMKRISEYLEDRREKFVRQIIAATQIVTVNNVFSLIINISAMLMTYHLFAAGIVTLGEVVLVFMLLAIINQSLNGIGNLISSLGRQYVDIEHGLTDIFVPHEIVDDPHAKPLKVGLGEIEFSNVSFSYQEQTVLKDFSLHIQPGERIGLVGPSGAGKSTLVSLLLRQHEVDQGLVTIDSQEINHVTQDSLRRHIAVVPQDTALFHRSIFENIRYGRSSASKKTVIEAAKLAQAHDFISALQDGYDTEVGERGVKLSGGQKQRIAIARAVLKDAPILVLDEATSALDSESEAAIQKALKKLMKGKTVIAVAHRLSTLREMDRILVIDDGKIVQDGTHEALLERKGLYAKLWTQQVGGFLSD